MQDYTTSFASGFALAAIAMVFAVTIAVIIRRWVGAEESWGGVLVRAGLLVGLFAYAMRHWGTAYSVAAACAAPLLLADAVWRGRVTAAWVKQQRRARSAEAAREAAVDPANPMVRLHLGQALLDEGRIASGLEALATAVELAPADSKMMVEQMAEEARQEFIRTCPECRKPNPVAALACQHCLAPLSESKALRIAVWCWRPVLRYLHS